MSVEDIDVLFRSRLTLLNILKENGYDTSLYETFGPWEIAAMFVGNRTFTMNVSKKEVSPDSPYTKCRVLYSLQKLKQRLNSFMNSLLDDDGENKVDVETEEVIVILLEDVGEVFHKEALSALKNHKLMIRFFKAHTLVYDPRSHVLVPKHTKLPASEHAEFLKTNYIRSKGNLPIIRFHEDMIARIMGLVPNDIVKITRPSPSAGLYDVYRVCVP
jgi:DNA-directed RNA polymerase subunit H (RpoH/RPB5)